MSAELTEEEKQALVRTIRFRQEFLDMMTQSPSEQIRQRSEETSRLLKSAARKLGLRLEL